MKTLKKKTKKRYLHDLRYTAFSEPLINVNDENNNNLHI